MHKLLVFENRKYKLTIGLVGKIIVWKSKISIYDRERGKITI